MKSAAARQVTNDTENLNSPKNRTNHSLTLLRYTTLHSQRTIYN